MQVLVAAAAVFGLLALPARADRVRTPAAWERVDAARALLDGVRPIEGAIELDVPLVTQEGGSVPVTVVVSRPMREDDFVAALYLFASGNPSPELLEVRFGPQAGRAFLSTRIRLDRSQTVVALARTSRGEWLAATRDVRVTVSGCLTRASGAGDDAMQTRVRAPERLGAGETGEVRTMILHPMETGLRKDEQGNAIPARIIRSFRAEFEGETVLEARLYRAIAANPFLHFAIAPPRGGTLRLHWEEDTGRTVSEAVKITM